MQRVLNCDCGYKVRADDEAEFVARVRRHALRDHGMRMSADEVLQLAFHAELDETVWQQRFGERRRDDTS